MSNPVRLFVYDLSEGVARMISAQLLGRQIEGIWHSSIVVYEREFSFGSNGIMTNPVDYKVIKNAGDRELMRLGQVIVFEEQDVFLPIPLVSRPSLVHDNRSCSNRSDGPILNTVPKFFRVHKNNGNTILGPPYEVIDLGDTHVPYSVFSEYIQGLKETSYTGNSYNLLKHNCNHFTDEIAQFLCGVRIPKHIIDLPSIVLESGIGPVIVQLVDSLSKGPPIRISGPGFRDDSPEFQQLNSAVEEVRRSSIALRESRKELSEKLAKKERKRKKKQKKEEKERQRIREIEKDLERNGYKFRPLPEDQIAIMAESGATSQNDESNEFEDQLNYTSEEANEIFARIEAEEKKELEELRRKRREEPVVFRDVVDPKVEYDALVTLLEGKLTPEEQKNMEELRCYMFDNEGSWILGDDFLNFIGRLFYDKAFNSDVRIHIINILANAALKEDLILLLHQDRKDHIIMNYADYIERLPPKEQEALSLLFVNLFDHLSASEWLLYISEWPRRNTNLSNIRVTTKVAVNALLSDNPRMQDYGTAIVLNMACKEVFEEVAVELTMSLLQFLRHAPDNEELMFRVMKSLVRLSFVSDKVVPHMIQMIGPQPSEFRGRSERTDEQIDILSQKIN